MNISKRTRKFNKNRDIQIDYSLFNKENLSEENPLIDRYIELAAYIHAFSKDEMMKCMDDIILYYEECRDISEREDTAKLNEKSKLYRYRKSCFDLNVDKVYFQSELFDTLTLNNGYLGIELIKKAEKQTGFSKWIREQKKKNGKDWNYFL